MGCTNPSSVRLQSLSSRPPCPPGPQTNRPCAPVRGHSPRESPLLVTQVLGAEAGGEGEELIPMNFYGTGLTPSLDWGPGRERHAFGRAPRPLPAPPCSMLCLRAERPGDGASPVLVCSSQLSTALDEFQEENHSEPTALFDFTPALLPRLPPCTAWNVPPALARPSSASRRGPHVVWRSPCMSQGRNSQLSALGQGNGSR